MLRVWFECETGYTIKYQAPNGLRVLINARLKSQGEGIV